MKKLLLLPILLLLGCTAEKSDPPKNLMSKAEFVIPVDGSVSCSWCELPVRTERYGGKLETRDNEEKTFMSAECMIAWMQHKNLETSDAASVKVIDFIDGKQLIDATDAVYLHSKLRPSPGKLFVTPMSNAKSELRANIHSAYPGPFLSWEETWNLVKEQYPSVLAHREELNGK